MPRRKPPEGDYEANPDQALGPFALMLRKAGISKDDLRRMAGEDPAAMQRLLREHMQMLRAEVPDVRERLAREAKGGNMKAVELFLTLVDEDYRDAVKSMKGDMGGGLGVLPSRDEFVRLLRVRLGITEEEYARLCGEAKKRGLIGGLENEEYLPGGSLSEERVLEAEVPPKEEK